MNITREYLIEQLDRLPPRARGRKILEHLLERLTTSELAKALKPRVRVKALAVRPKHGEEHDA